MIFPTWTVYGGQDDLTQPWENATIHKGTKLDNNTWKYHVDISTHNYEAGKYITHIYILDNQNNLTIVENNITNIIETENYVASLYLTETDSIFDNKYYQLSTNVLNTNFTFEFDAQPLTTTPIFSNGIYADTTQGLYNFIIQEAYVNESNIAGSGLSLGTNGVIAIAHAPNYYYVLLSYQADLSNQHRYRFTINSNIPQLYIDGNLVATGIAPPSPVTTLYSNNVIGSGVYGNYSGYANNFVLYNNAR